MNQSKLAKYLSYLAALILVLVPFQALITTWIGANFGHLDLIRIWKEILLVPLAVGSLYLVYTDKKLKTWFRHSKLVLLITIYICLQLGMAIYAFANNKVDGSAVVYGLMINLRFFIFFLACLIVATKTDWLVNHWTKIILWPAAVVVAFGLMQQFILQKDFLRHFGYGPMTIPTHQAVDNKPNYSRVQSTLRGPNPLGAYLVVILTILVAFFLRPKRKLVVATAILASLVVLYFSYSRSAWLGIVVSVLLVTLFVIKDAKSRKWLLLGSSLVLVVFIGTILLWNRNSVVSNTLFHTSKTSQSLESSNAVRTEAMLSGAKSVIKQPLGDGPGTAGPASVRNHGYQPRIAENYFIQVGQETGLIGAALFVAITVYVGMLLWRARDQELAKIALAALIGLSLVNMLSHAWADDTLAYIYWGLAGIALASSVILNKERKPKHGKVKEKTA